MDMTHNERADQLMYELSDASILALRKAARAPLHAAVDDLVDKVVAQAVPLARTNLPEASDDELREMCTRIAVSRMLLDLKATNPDVKVAP